MRSRINSLDLAVVGILSLSVAGILSSPFGENRIFGGKEVERGQFPYHATIRAKYDMKGPYTNRVCGGSIISEKFVLTAAHCVRDYNQIFDPIYFRIFVGESSTYDGEAYKANAFIPHEDSNIENSTNDIALIQLKDSIKFSSLIAPVQLGRNFFDGRVRAVATGSGANRHLNPDHILQYLYMETMSNDDCRAIYRGRNEPIYDFITICAYSGEKGQGVCHVDSGGPLVYNNTVIGVTVWVTGNCAEGVPDGFMRVSAYVDWIDNKMLLAV